MRIYIMSVFYKDRTASPMTDHYLVAGNNPVAAADSLLAVGIPEESISVSGHWDLDDFSAVKLCLNFGSIGFLVPDGSQWLNDWNFEKKRSAPKPKFYQDELAWDEFSFPIDMSDG